MIGYNIEEIGGGFMIFAYVFAGVVLCLGFYWSLPHGN